MTTYVVGLAGGRGDRRPPSTGPRPRPASTTRSSRSTPWEIPVVTGYESVAAIDTEAIEESATDYVATVLRDRDDDRITRQDRSAATRANRSSTWPRRPRPAARTS